MSIQSDLEKVTNLLDRIIEDMHLSVRACGCFTQEDKAKTMILAIEAEQMITKIKGE